MSKSSRSVFVCQICGYQTVKWLGRCPDCSNWNSIIEEKVTKAPPRAMSGTPTEPQTVDQIAVCEEQRLATGSVELDRVLGGGIVGGSAILIGGDPGIGKSTLLLQTLHNLGQSGNRILYVSGEESARQIRLRSERIGALSSNVYIVTENSTERIVELFKKLKPGLLAIDSIQTLYTEEIGSAPGSVSQVRESGARLISLAKDTGIPLILIGHVTKEGTLAGPRVLEHMVDAVLYFEGDRGHAFRILRTVKNRYGSTNEIGVFEMKEQGLVEMLNPSEIFLAERPIDISGSVVVPSLEGTRPILVEVQALVSQAGFGMPRRTSMGIDPQRISIIVAVLEKRLGLILSDKDIYLNIIGGIRLEEPAVDLGAAMAIVSSALDKPIDHDLVVFGEIGLAGEVRAVSQADVRLAEASRLGFTHCLLPGKNLEQVKNKCGMALQGIANLRDILDRMK